MYRLRLESELAHRVDRLRLKMSFSSSTEVNSNCTILYESHSVVQKCLYVYQYLFCVRSISMFRMFMYDLNLQVELHSYRVTISTFERPPRLQIGRMELFAKLENSDKRVRIGALRELAQRQLEPATLAQHANAVVAMLEDSEESVREAALKTLRKLGPTTLAQHADAVFARLEDYESVRVYAFWTLCQLEPAALAQYADVVIARLESSYIPCRMAALMVLVQLEPATLEQHCEAVAARLEDSCLSVRRLASKTLDRLEPEMLGQHADAVITRFGAQHADAVITRFEDEISFVRRIALETLKTLEPFEPALHAGAVVASLEGSLSLSVMRSEALGTLGKQATFEQDLEAVAERLEDAEMLVSRVALKTLANLEPAMLAQHVGAVVARLADSDRLVRSTAFDALSKLPHDIIRGVDFDSHELECWPMKRSIFPFAACNGPFSYGVSKFSGRLLWYRFRIRWRVYRLVLYWYALPYRPSGAGHARDVEAWDRMNETRGQTPRLQKKKKKKNARGMRKT